VTSLACHAQDRNCYGKGTHKRKQIRVSEALKQDIRTIEIRMHIMQNTHTYKIDSKYKI